jgi:hypothetical protein
MKKLVLLILFCFLAGSFVSVKAFEAKKEYVVEKNTIKAVSFEKQVESAAFLLNEHRFVLNEHGFVLNEHGSTKKPIPKPLDKKESIPDYLSDYNFGFRNQWQSRKKEPK